MKNITDLLHQQGLRTFLWVWLGSFVSFFGTAMTRFALMIWAYQQTGSATTLALLGTANYVPYLIAGPLAGVIVDRLDRRLILLLSDLLSGLVTIALLLLFLSGGLQIWHLYAAEALTGLFEAFQVPAYYAAVSLLVPKDQIQRTNGMRSLAADGSRVLAPLAAGAVLAWLGISGVMMLDVVTFLFSVSVLALVFIPRPQPSAAGAASRGNFWFELRSGLLYIQRRPGLIGLLLVLFGMNVLASLTYFSILPAMILARSGQSEMALGIVQSVLGAGGMIGALLLSIWGGARKRIHNVLAAGAISFFLGDLLFGLGQSVPVWAAAAFFSTVFIPFISGSSQAIWQVKVEPDLQGRVLSLKDTLQQVLMPFGYAAGGLLADNVFEPAL
ncbi:MAG: MFS transporter, partial [Anaerolineaceae bacterium]|nr:MFS transporter [Anaerolineaceae bacterium]